MIVREGSQMIKTTLMVVLAGGFAVSTALAGEDPGKSEMRFKQLDTNNNGHISQYEAKDKHRVFYYYQKADRNEDGHLDKSEFSAFEIETPDWGTK